MIWNRKTPAPSRFGAMVALGTMVAVTAHADSGAISLVDSTHLEYFINQDITFNTTSSASGAASEASFTTNIVASTELGATEMVTLSDAFDGALTLAVSLTEDMTVPATSNAGWTFYNNNGATHPNDACLAGGTTVSSPATLTGAVFVTTGFVGGEIATIAINRVATDVMFTVADQTPAEVATRINTVLGSPVATADAAGAIILTSSHFATAMSLTGTAATAIGFDMPVYGAGSLGDSRETIFPDQMIDAIRVSRRVFVPDDDSFMRHFNRFENTGATSVTFTVGFSNNLGSDSNTKLFATSSGDLIADPADQWVGSFQNWSGGTSSDPRLAFVLANTSSPTKPVVLNYVDGDDNPYWIYTLTLAPGEVKSVLGFAVVSGTQAASQATAVALLDPRTRAAALRCLSDADRASIVNLPAAPCSLATETSCDDGDAGTTNDVCTGYHTCAGTPIPVDAGMADAGMTDAGTADAGTVTDAGTVAPKSDDGCGCVVAGSSTKAPAGWLGAVLIAGAWMWRVGRRAAPRQAARARGRAA